MCYLAEDKVELGAEHRVGFDLILERRLPDFKND